MAGCRRSDGGGLSEYGSSADGDLEGFAEALALPEESESPFFGGHALQNPTPSYRGPKPAFSLPPASHSPSPDGSGRHLASAATAIAGGSLAASAAARPASFAVDAVLCDAGERPRDFTPFPGMIGPGWESSGDGAGVGVAEFVPPQRQQETTTADSGLANGGGANGGGAAAAMPLGMGLGLGAFGLGGSMWGAPPQAADSDGSWGSALTAPGGRAAADPGVEEGFEEAGGIGKAALAKLWE